MWRVIWSPKRFDSFILFLAFPSAYAMLRDWYQVELNSCSSHFDLCCVLKMKGIAGVLYALEVILCAVVYLEGLTVPEISDLNFLLLNVVKALNIWQFMPILGLFPPPPTPPGICSFCSFLQFLGWFKIRLWEILMLGWGNYYLLAIRYILSVSPVISYDLTLLFLPVILDFYMNNWHLLQGEKVIVLFLAYLGKKLVFAFDICSWRIVIPTVLLL